MYEHENIIKSSWVINERFEMFYLLNFLIKINSFYFCVVNVKTTDWSGEMNYH